ncbi:MAG TPA: CarD family transcriptional regulator, partial [Stellaceae bacterium]|nr:CarD family transcriptional regulator [Stellaceae bacterium]
MTPLHELLRTAGRVDIFGAPEGRDVQLFSELAAGGFAPVLLFVARDDARLHRLRAAFAFFAPGTEVLLFPAWDCLPYDRVSPAPDLVSRRIDTLTRLAGEPKPARPRIVLTTVNALVQRVPPRKVFRERTLALKRGGRIPTDRLISFLQANGYVRTETVRDRGDYAVRGGIVDLFPSGAPEPLRIDFFGDEIDGIRRFDAMTQRSTAKLDAAALKPVSEVLLDEASITRFRSRYRDLFGPVDPEDGLYAAVSEGRRHVGMEHWLPLYYEQLETLLDYLPGAVVALDHRAEEIRATRLESIGEFYAARQSLTGARNVPSATLYKPVEPDLMFIGEAEWHRLLDARPYAQLTPFPPPPDSGARAFDGGGRPGISFAEARANPKVNVFEAVGKRIAELKDSGRKVAIAAFTNGSADRLLHVLGERGIDGVERADAWPALQELSPRKVGLVVLPLEQGYQAGKLTLISEQDILGDRLVRPRRRRTNVEKFIEEVSALSVGDFVVHADHGIGRYDGLVTLDVGGAAHDCLKVVYQGDDKLFVPVENIGVLSRYGAEDAAAQLDKLGGVAWQGRKARVKKRIKDMADELIKVAAERELRQGETVEAASGLYDEFAARFPYPETDDQLNAIGETIDDLGSGKPMDRLICGDVGFGKTEVALRAAFVAAMAGVQVAVIVPTTLLARQHFRTFGQRFQGL